MIDIAFVTRDDAFSLIHRIKDGKDTIYAPDVTPEAAAEEWMAITEIAKQLCSLYAEHRETIKGLAWNRGNQ